MKAPPPPPRALARYNLDGTRDASFSVGDGANARITTAAFTSTGELFVAGSFGTIKGVTRPKFAWLVGNPQIGAVGFAPARQIETERAGSVTLTLRRYGPATEAASIRWATSGGILSDTSATAGEDYTTATGTVSWAAGDSADKTLSVQLLNDSAQEPTERFRVVLSDPSGPVTAAAVATIELLDDDTPATFTAQPTPTSTLGAGANLSLSATVTSPTPVTYQWFLNGMAIPGATSATYAKNAISAADAGLYTVVATNAAGGLTSSAAHVIVSPVAGKLFPGQATTGRPSFTAAPAAIVPLADGGALVGGSFNINVSTNVPQDYLIRIRADGSTDTSFNLVPSGSITALLRQPDDKILVLGTFFTFGGTSTRYLVRLNSDLTLDTAFNTAVGTSISSSLGAPTDLALDSTGRIYVSFDNGSLGGAVLRLSPSGVIDTTYNVSTTSVSFGAGVLALAVQPDDRLLLAGNFTSVTGGGQPAVAKSRLARLSTAGVVDTTFSPAVGSYSFQDLLVTSSGRIFGAGSSPSVFEANPDGSGTVFSIATGNQAYELASGPDGRLAVARASSGGSGSVFRLNLPASVGGSATADTTFQVGTGPNGDVRALAYAADGSLWLAGLFTNFDGFASGGVVRLQGSVGDPGIVNPPARADVNPGATARFSVGAIGTNLSYQWLKNGNPLANDTRISGATTATLSITGVTVADADTYSVRVTGGTPATTVLTSPSARLNVLGAPTVAASPASATPALGATVTLAADVLAATPATYVWKRDGVLLINGGRYSGATTATLVITGANASDNGAYTLTVTNALGSVSTTPAPVTVAQVATDRDSTTTALSTTINSNFTRRALALLHLPDGRTLVGTFGDLNGAASTSSSTKLSIVETDGRVTPSSLGVFNDKVTRLIRQPDGKILVMGSFTAIGSNSGPGFTRLVRLNADLTRDTSFAPYLPTTPPTTAVVDAQGRIYLLCGVLDYEGRTGYNFLVRLRPDGTHDLSFNLNLENTPNDVVLQADGKILIAGRFRSYGTPTTPIKGLLRLNADGTVDTGFTSAAIPSAATSLDVTAITLDSQGRIVVGYNYVQSTFNFGISRLLPTGALDSSFNLGESITNSPTLLVPVADDQILVAGLPSSPDRGLVRLNSNGTRDTAFATGLGSGFGAGIFLRSIVPDARGRVWIGGDFTTFKGASASGIVVLQGSGAPAPALAFTTPPTGQLRDLGTTVTFTAAATGNNGFTYRWHKNGAPLSDSARISGSTTTTLTLTGLVASDAAAYTLVATAPSGPTTFASATSASAQLVVLAAPEITGQPSAATADLGTSATFTASARGAGSLTYQWLFGTTPLTNGTTGGVTIAGATTPSLTLSGLTFAQAGEYRLRVTNSLGTATTQPAVLTVQKRPGSLASGPLGTISANNPVLAILRLQDGSMLVGGQFSSITVNGVVHNRSSLARFLADGTLDPAFTPTISGDVRALAQDSAGRVFIGGGFTGSVTIGGTTATRTRVARLTSALVLDTDFNTAAGPNGNINALAPTNDGGVYVGGASSFTAVGTTTGILHLARLSSTGGLDTTFTAPTLIRSGDDVFALLRRPDGKLYIGGGFGTALLTASGTRDTAFVPAAPSVLAVQGQALQLLPDGSLLLGANGALPQPYLRRLNANTGTSLADYSALLTALTPPLPHSGPVTALAQQADGKLLSGALGTLKRTNLTGTLDREDPDNPTSPELFAAFDTTISAIAVDGAGRIWVGGSFSAYGTTAKARLAVLTGGEPDSRDGLLEPQTLTFPAIPNRTFGATVAANTFALPAATSDRSLTPITFRVTSGPATVTGSTLTITGAGTITVEAAQAGNSTIRAATATQTFTVAKATQTVDFAQLADKTTSSAPFTVSATASSGLPVTFSVTGEATLSTDGITVVLSGVAGTVTVTATQAGDANYHPASQSRTFNVTAGTPQTITWTQPLPARVTGSPAFALTATATSGLTPVTFSVVSGPATITGSSLTLTSGLGTVTVRAIQAGGTRNGVTYAPTSLERSFDVIAGPPTLAQTITFAPPAAVTYGVAPLALTATATSGLPVTFTLVSTRPITGVATLAGNTLTITGAGTVTLRADQPGDSTRKPAAPVTRTLTINKAPLAVSFEPATRLVGQPNPAFVPTYEGFVNGDDATDLDPTRPLGTTKATPSSSAGQYAITFTGGLDNHYRFVAGAPAFLTVQGFGGTYEALLVDEAGTPRGKLALLVRPNALTYTGTLDLASEPVALPIGDALAATTGASATGTWARTTNGLAELRLGFEIAGNTLDGQLSRNGEPFLTIGSGSRLFVQALSGKTKLPSPWTGSHTLVLRDPAPLAETDTRALPLGSGHASGVIAATGTLKLTGRLADGTALTTSATADTTGRHRLFVRPYGKRLDSFLSGELALEPHPDQVRFQNRHHVSAEDGRLAWAKADLPDSTLERNKDKSYRAGFESELVAALDPWLPPATRAATANGVTIPAGNLAQRLALATNATTPATAEVAFTLPESLTLGARASFLPASLTLSPVGAFSVPLPLPAATNNPAFTLKVTPSTGAFTGAFTLRDQVAPPPARPIDRKVSISGTLRQGPAADSTLGHAHFLLDPIPGDTGANSAEQISAELVLTPETSPE